MRTFAAAALLACCVPVVSQAAITIQNGYLQVGVSDQGTLGSDNSTEPGILYDPTGSGTYGTADFLTPGTPFEGFYIKIGGTTYTANNDTSDASSYGTFTLTPISATSATAQATSTDGAITILNTYTLGTLGGAPAINVSTKITNSSASTLTGVEFLRTLDPDQDENTHGTDNTNNSVFSNKQVCAAGPVSGATICLSTSDATDTVNAGVSEAWSTDPDDYLAGLNDGNGDNAIGLAFGLGNLAAGASVTITYAYSFSLVPPPLSVPAPTLGLGALYLLGALLSLVAWLNRATMARMVRRSLGS